MALSTTTTSLETSTPTVTSLLSFTTPFVEPPNCGEALFTTSISERTQYGGSVTWTTLLPDESDPRFTSCQPSGWANVVSESRFSFSPAVCPKSWTAWYMAQNTVIDSFVTSTASTHYVTTAYCCAPNYSIKMAPQPPFTSPSCSRYYTSLSINSSMRATEIMTLSGAYLPAWHVSWEQSDRRTMSPQPPGVQADKTIISWAEGSDPGFQKEDKYNADGVDGPLFLFLVIGLPLMFLVAVGGCIACCCVSRSRKKKKRLVVVVGNTGTPKGSGTTSTAS